jgi:hypothetical protein
LSRSYRRRHGQELRHEHRSTYHLLTHAPSIARKFDEAEHVTEDGSIDWDALEAECFSTTSGYWRASRVTSGRGPATRR